MSVGSIFFALLLIGGACLASKRARSAIRSSLPARLASRRGVYTRRRKSPPAAEPGSGLIREAAQMAESGGVDNYWNRRRSYGNPVSWIDEDAEFIRAVSGQRDSSDALPYILSAPPPIAHTFARDWEIWPITETSEPQELGRFGSSDLNLGNRASEDRRHPLMMNRVSFMPEIPLRSSSRFHSDVPSSRGSPFAEDEDSELFAK